MLRCIVNNTLCLRTRHTTPPSLGERQGVRPIVCERMRHYLLFRNVFEGKWRCSLAHNFIVGLYFNALFEVDYYFIISRCRGNGEATRTTTRINKWRIKGCIGQSQGLSTTRIGNIESHIATPTKVIERAFVFSCGRTSQRNYLFCIPNNVGCIFSGAKLQPSM